MWDRVDYPKYLRWDAIPELKDPIMVLGFHGWSDAGNISSDTLQYVTQTQRAQSIGSLSDEPFINFTLDRPLAEVKDGLIRHVDPMVTKLQCWINGTGNHDVVFMLGKEPHFNWFLYSGLLLYAMRRLGVTRCFTIGGVQDTISHSSNPVISVVASSPKEIEEVMDIEPGIQPAEYSGPISIHSSVLNACMEEDMPAVSLWGHVPAYLQKNPRQVARMVKIINKTADMDCPVDILMKKSIELDRKIDEALAKDPNLKQFVETIEGKQESGIESDREDKIVRLNDFLRRDSHRDPDS